MPVADPVSTSNRMTLPRPPYVLTVTTLPFSPPCGVAATAHELPFQTVPVGQVAVSAEEDATVEPQALLAVAVQFVDPGRAAPKAPEPPDDGLRTYDTAFAPEQLIEMVMGPLPPVVQLTV